MRIFGEPRIYLSVAASLPILLIVVNQTVALSLLQAAQTLSFTIWLILVSLYLVIRRGGYLSRIRSLTAQVVLETSILSAPLAYPMYILFTQGVSYEYEGIFLAYITLGIALMLYQLGRRGGVGSVGKIASFLLAYIFSLMVYAGSLTGQQTGTFFLLIVAFDQLFRVAALAGYPAYLITPPLEAYVQASMALATPAVILLSLSAELERSEAEGLQGGGLKLTSSLRPAIILLTFTGVSSLLLTLPPSLWLAESSIYLTTILPPLGVAALLLLILLVLERRQGAEAG